MKSTILSLLCICMLGIAAAAADTSKVVYSTHLNNVFLTAIAADVRGNVYVTGFSPNSEGTNSRIFVAKLDRKGRVVYSTYIGDPAVGDSGGEGIAVDFKGNAYVTGFTSGGLPTTPNAYQKEPAGDLCGRGVADAFVVKLDDEGKLVYGTYISGGCDDSGSAIAVDLWGNAYVTGVTLGDFPITPSTINNNTTCSEFCGFVAKLDPTGSSLVYSDYLGELDVSPSDIAVDLFGHAYVTGTATIITTTPNSFEPTLISLENFEPFVAKLNSTGESFVYSTYLAGHSDEGLGVLGFAGGIAVDLLGNAYVTGTTMKGFPTTPNSVQPTFPGTGVTSAFVAKLNDTGNALIYSTYLSSAASGGNDIAVDLRGDAYVLWDSTTSPSYAKVSRLNATGSSLINIEMGKQQLAPDSKIAVDYAGDDVYVATFDGLVTRISTSGNILRN